jgi:hypothetical protein
MYYKKTKQGKTLSRYVILDIVDDKGTDITVSKIEKLDTYAGTHKHTVASKEKMSQSHTGKHHSEATKEKIRASRYHGGD